MPYLVRENLFIGNITDAAEVLQGGGRGGITRVLSVLSSPSISFFSEWKSGLVIPSMEIKTMRVPVCDRWCLPREKILYVVEQAGEGLRVVRMGVGVRDMETENLLDYFEACLDFIDKSRKEGSVLVHCFAGVSRSAAVVTAYLMRSELLSQNDALEALKQCCEFVCPNDGFLDQLKMFEEMGFVVDRSSPIYKRFRLKVLGDSYNRGEKIDSSKFGVDPGVPTEAPPVLLEASLADKKSQSTGYRCKKCRRVVALQENVIDHIPGEGETFFSWNKRNSGNPCNKLDDSECSSAFVEPLQWMSAVEEGVLEGKLQCAHCEARLGYFNWSGIQCSCGSWITPAFQIHKSRVDVSTV